MIDHPFVFYVEDAKWDDLRQVLTLKFGDLSLDLPADLVAHSGLNAAEQMTAEEWSRFYHAVGR